MEIRISKEEILNGDISKIKSIVEKFALDSRLSAENENNISIKFDKLSTFDLSMKLMDEEYKAWFRKLDAEFPYLSFFLNKQSRTLMFFIMGNIDFTIDDENNILFDDNSRKHYVRNRIPFVRNFCVSHNIEYKNALHNLVAFEPDMQKAAPQKIRIEDLLMRFGSIAYISEQREYILSILTKEIPKRINIHGVFYTDKNCAQPFFTVFMEEDRMKTRYTVHSQVSQRETEEYFNQTPEVRILVVFKNDDDQLSAFPKISTKVVMATKEELAEQEELFLGNGEEEPEPVETFHKPSLPNEEPEMPEEPEPKPVETHQETSISNKEPEEQEKPEKPEPVETFHETSLPNADVADTPEIPEKITKKTVEEAVPENETPEEKIARLEKKISELEEKIRQKDNLIKAKDNLLEEYEKAINQKRSFWSFIKGMFK